MESADEREIDIGVSSLQQRRTMQEDDGRVKQQMNESKS